MPQLESLAPFTEEGSLTVVIETPKGSHNKLTFVPDGGYIELGDPLPLGAVFPFDFGFVPRTLAGDGDPIDVLVLLDGGVYPGVVLKARLVGAIMADQTERDGTCTRNDRLIAVAEKSRLHADVKSLDDLPGALLDEIEHFFQSYNDLKGKTFTPRGRGGPDEARALVEDAITPGED